jgi:hypothetical protein
VLEALVSPSFCTQLRSQPLLRGQLLTTSSAERILQPLETLPDAEGDAFAPLVTRLNDSKSTFTFLLNR